MWILREAFVTTAFEGLLFCLQPVQLTLLQLLHGQWWQQWSDTTRLDFLEWDGAKPWTTRRWMFWGHPVTYFKPRGYRNSSKNLVAVCIVIPTSYVLQPSPCAFWEDPLFVFHHDLWETTCDHFAKAFLDKSNPVLGSGCLENKVLGTVRTGNDHFLRIHFSDVLLC